MWQNTGLVEAPLVPELREKQLPKSNLKQEDTQPIAEDGSGARLESFCHHFGSKTGLLNVIFKCFIFSC